MGVLWSGRDEVRGGQAGEAIGKDVTCGAEGAASKEEPNAAGVGGEAGEDTVVDETGLDERGGLDGAVGVADGDNGLEGFGANATSSELASQL